MMVEVKVESILFDLTTNAPVVVLKDLEGNRVLPIWIGPFEASAIEMEIENVKHPRPLTHDLMRNMLDSLNAEVTKVGVVDLQDNTFIAAITLQMNGQEFDVDARPSDAIALALRVHCPIFAKEDLLKDSSLLETSGDQPDEEKERFRQFLEGLKPDDFKYRH